MKKRSISCCFLILRFLPSILVAQTPPGEFLGHRVGADHKLADYSQIQVYFRKLAEESAKIEVLTIGHTTLDKPMIMAVITSEENMAKLDQYREITGKLRDARGLTTEEAKRRHWSTALETGGMPGAMHIRSFSSRPFCTGTHSKRLGRVSRVRPGFLPGLHMEILGCTVRSAGGRSTWSLPRIPNEFPMGGSHHEADG